MKELLNVRQIDGEPTRRWFSDDYFDLITFYEGESIFAFHLCYDKQRQPKILVWDSKTGYAHGGIDDGEERPGKMKSSPVMVADGLFAKESVAEQFRKASRSIDSDVAEYVLSKIADYQLDQRNG